MSTQSKHKDSHIQEIIGETKSIWGQDCKIAPDKTKKDSYRVSVRCSSQRYKNGEIPVNDFIDGRKGRFKGGMEDILLSERKLRQELNRDKCLRKKASKLAGKSRDFGAKNLRMCYVVPNSNDGTVVNSPENMLKKPGVYYRYKKATGYDVNWQTYERVLETNFGRTGLYAEQALVAVILGNLFPETKDGQPVRLDQNLRGLLKKFGPAAARLEIDISIGNLLGDDGFKLFVEYDGHQAHRDDHETKVRDRKKEAWARQLGLFIRVPKLKSLNVEMAWNQVIECYEQSHHKKKREFDKLVRKDGNKRLFNKIRRERDKLLKDLSLDKTIKVREKAKSLGHRLTCDDNAYFMRGDEVKYICRCKAGVKTSVHNYIYNTTRFCAACKGQSTTTSNNERRAALYKKELGVKIIDALPSGVLEQLIGVSAKEKITCPHCKTPVALGHTEEDIIDFLKKEGGFTCIHCYSTGTPITDNAQSAGAVYQNLPKIKSIIHRTGWGDESRWMDYFSIRPDIGAGRFFVSLKDPSGLIHEMTLAEWDGHFQRGGQPRPAKKEGGNNGLGMDEHVARVRRFHPLAVFKSIEKNDGIEEWVAPMVLNCGRTSVVGGLEVPHGDFYVTRTKALSDYKANKPGFSYCIVCSDELGMTMPGTDKRFEQLQQRLRFRAALVIDAGDKKHTLDAVKITGLLGERTGVVGSSDRLLFHCHNPAHKPKEDTLNNYFNKHKAGYCRQCLKDAGTNSINAIKNSRHQ